MNYPSIHDPIDLVENLLTYFASDLNNYIAAVNTEKNARYGTDAEMENIAVFGQREKSKGRQNEKVKFQLIRDDIQFESKVLNENYLAGQTVNIGCYVYFYDDGTDNSFSKGQRYEESVYRAIRGVGFKETSGWSILGRSTAPFTIEKSGQKTPQGLIAAGVVISVKLGG